MSLKNQKRLFIILLIILLAVALLNIANVTGKLILGQSNIKVDNGEIDLSSLNLNQKIAQMVIVRGDLQNIKAWKKLQIGGFHLFGRANEQVFRDIIDEYQKDRSVPFFISADLEGCVSPFVHYRNFTYTSEVDNTIKAFQKGLEEGEYLSDLGFSINFAPVVDLDDDIWGCRTFPGNESQITELAQAYTLALESKGVIGSIKHYPGKTLVIKDPHKFIVVVEIEEKDLFPYRYFFEEGEVGSVMVTHIIASGEVDSEGVPSVTSKKIIDGIREDYNGLIISDEIHMLGLKNFFKTLDELYVAIFKAGNDIILNFDNDPNEIQRMIDVVKKAVEEGEIPVSQIDDSVTRILRAKGFSVK